MAQRQVYIIIGIILYFSSCYAQPQVIVSPGGLLRPNMGGMHRKQKQNKDNEGISIQYNYKLVKYKDTFARCRRTTWESLDALLRNDQAYKEGIIIQNLENDLDSCKSSTETKVYNYHALADAEIQLAKLKKEDKSFHTFDYEKEIIFYKAVTEKVELDRIFRKTENMYLDSIISSRQDTSLGPVTISNPAIADQGVQKWEMATQMDVIANHHCLTTFCASDYNFAQPRLNKFLVSMGLSRQHDSLYKTKGLSQPMLQYTYFTISSTGVAENRLTLTYYFQDNSFPLIIKSCEIKGDSTILKNLFIKYWPLNTYPGSRATAAIANKYLFNDFISLTQDINSLKIVISPANKNLKANN